MRVIHTVWPEIVIDQAISYLKPWGKNRKFSAPDQGKLNQSLLEAHYIRRQ
jgi:hypothetical protein